MITYLNIILRGIIVLLPVFSSGQSRQTLSEICGQVSKQWTLDSNACRGERLRLSSLLLKAKPDSISKAFLFSTLGKPNSIQHIYVGYPENKRFVEYIYFIYKDNCPEIMFEGSSVAFVFDETESYFIKITTYDYCG